MIDIENLIDEIDLIKCRIRDTREELKKIKLEFDEKGKEFVSLKEYRDYLLALKKVNE